MAIRWTRWVGEIAMIAVAATALARDRSKTEKAFEPPKYIASLIAAVNDGAKSAQTGALAFTLVGLYLLATAFSTTDEDLLLQHTMPVSQIGVQVPAIFSFAIAPVVFLFIHTYTLIRYDMLAANLRHFRIDLQASVLVEADRERCRQLLANVEFVQARTAPQGSPLYSRLYRLVAWLVLAGFPVGTFIAVQISSLRYQSNVVTETQQVSLALDLVLLGWFVHRHRHRGELLGGPFNVRWPLAWFLPMCVLALDLLYLNVPGANNETVRDGDHGADWSEAYEQPLDLVLCPTLQWGCRYLTLDHRTRVGHVWKPEAIADLRAGKDEPRVSLAAIEGIVLRSRSLRFAKLDESRLYAGDMIGSDLSRATFLSAQLQGVNLSRADLNGANLTNADLSYANLSHALLNDADLRNADLRNVDLSGADLSDAKLSDAHLHNADLSDLADLHYADLSRADLNGANLTNADLTIANLSGADLSGANLSYANLSYALLNGADLSDAKLSDADLHNADLSDANLSRADLSRAFLNEADLSDAKNLTQAQLVLACGKPKALPPGRTLDQPCPLP